MAEKKHVRGVGPKEQREYEHIKESAQKSGRYGRRLRKWPRAPSSSTISRPAIPRANKEHAGIVIGGTRNVRNKPRGGRPILWALVQYAICPLNDKLCVRVASLGCMPAGENRVEHPPNQSELGQN